MHELLESVYQHYEIVIWSQTSWKWLEMKITELGLLTHPAYRVAWVMDRTSMFKVNGQRRGKPYVHEVKALDVIFAKLPQFTPANTIHIDDLARNFVMNPGEGLRISAFRNGPENRGENTLYL
jgi:ubiquitin-like domain-containing CTD phosphatase 1